jgi:hypothetical protein
MKSISNNHNVPPAARGCGKRVSSSSSNSGSLPEWSPTERVVLDLELPHTAIARALDRLDDAAIWSEYRRSADEAVFLDYLGTLAGNYSTRQPHFRDPARTTEWRHVLTVVPFLLRGNSWPVAAPAGEDRGAAGTTVKQLQHWVGYQQPAMIVLNCVRYTDLCRWSPVMQREYLQVLAQEKRALCTPLELFPAHVPEGLAQLAFVVSSVSCWNDQPTLPGASECSAQSWDMRSRLAACLSYSQQCSVRAEDVLLPARLREGVLAGLRLWLGALARAGHVRSWDVQPGRTDVVLLELTTREKESSPAVVPVRLHQIGPDGFGILMADLMKHFGPAGTSRCQFS